MAALPKDRAGERYGRLVLVSRTDSVSGNGVFKWLCLCDCGRNIVVSVHKMVSGHTRSCGCLHKEATKMRHDSLFLSHGQARRGKVSKIYRVWSHMLWRVKTDPDYESVTVCERWLSFENFYSDMGDKPDKDGMSLDRIDNSKGYEPGNCRWATAIEQANNKSTNLRVSHNGHIKTMAEWSRELGVPYGKLYRRYKKSGVLV